MKYTIFQMAQIFKGSNDKQKQRQFRKANK